MLILFVSAGVNVNKAGFLLLDRAMCSAFKLVKVLFFGFTFFVFTSCGVIADAENSKTRSIDQKIEDALNGIPYREMLYSQEFQTRFSLPPKGSSELGKGLLAIALEVHAASSGSGLLLCGLHLYVDSALVKLSLPSTPSGINPSADSTQGHFFVDRFVLNETDGAFRIATLNEYNSRLLIESDSYPKGVTSTMGIQNYTVELYPGISYFYFSPPCGALDFNKSGAVAIWLNKTSDPQNLPQADSKGNPQQFYQFSLPSRLSKSFAPVIEKLNATNKKNRDDYYTFMRKYREILDKEMGFGIPAE